MKPFRTPAGLPLPASPDVIEAARGFLLARWKERAAERGLPEPRDLSRSCKFSALFARSVFGGRLEGNRHHVYLRLPDRRLLDLNEDACDVASMRERGLDPHCHDPFVWKEREHLASIRSCSGRVAAWVHLFTAAHGVATAPPPGRRGLSSSHLSFAKRNIR